MQPQSYRLISGTERESETFEIPARTVRESLPTGIFAKIGFERIDPHSSELGGERFWVRVQGCSDTGDYVGTIDNPLVGAWGTDLGDAITFGPDNVLDVFDPDTPQARAAIKAARKRQCR